LAKFAYEIGQGNFMTKEKILIVFTVLVDVLGFAIVIPILPFYVTSFGVSPFTVTLLFATFAFFSFLSSPFLGRLSDRVGRRPVLLVSLFSTAVGWFIFASARTVPMLFLGRAIDGAAAGNIVIAQSYLVDISRSEKERSENLGLIGAAFGFGFMVGPTIGGVLSTVSHAFPFFFAGILALLNTIGAYFFLPESHHQRAKDLPLSFNPLTPLAKAAFDVKLRPLYVTWTLFILAFFIGQSVFGLFADRALGFDAFITGMLFTGSGAFVVLNQALLLRTFWLKRFAEPRLTVMMMSVFSIGFLLMAIPLMSLFLLGVVLLSTGQSILRVLITSQVAGRSDPATKGETMGILTSIMAAALVVGPIVGGLLFEIHYALPYLAGSLLGGYAFLLSKKELERNGLLLPQEGRRL
jgi:DHA1 family tetracycline resistance protein-like MFS transporter